MNIFWGQLLEFEYRLDCFSVVFPGFDNCTALLVIRIRAYF